MGALTGAWAADLWDPKYLGEGNFLLKIKSTFSLIDPLDKPVVMLLVVLGIGIFNQLYGVLLKGYGLLRRGHVLDAVLDAGLWLIVLPGFLIVASKLFMPTPGWLSRLGTWMLALGGLGLMATQGRKEPTLSGKIITGIVSLYGILGSYGCMAFVGDMLSYSRLLALGLTTTIVGMSFNIIADLLRDVPYVGAILFVGMLVVGHLFNFAISILGAFVHSARLIFLEFFGRFYEPNGVPFRPLSVSTERVMVTRR
jgi:V/A-type H+-transporting ATPase subunit I